MKYDGLLSDLLWRVSLSILKINKIMLLLLRIFSLWESMKCSMSWTDEIEIWYWLSNTLLQFFYLTAWTHCIFSITDVSYMYKLTSLPDTWNFKSSSSFCERCEIFHIRDGHFGKKCHFCTPAENGSFTPLNNLIFFFSWWWKPFIWLFLKCHGWTKCSAIPDHVHEYTIVSPTVIPW